MSTVPETRILLVADEPTPSAGVLEILARRAAAGPVALRIVIPNPVHAEASLLHPDRHRGMPKVQQALDRELPFYSAVVDSAVSGTVSVRHDAFDAVEEELASHDADEIVVGLHRDSSLSRRLHHDLGHRLASLHRTVTLAEPADADA